MVKILAWLLIPLPILGRMMIAPMPYSYSAREKENKNHLQVDVFYEALCPDSKNFFLDTLSPTLHQFNQINQYISVTMVPYGKAQTTQTNPYQFSCQHGSQECQGNLYHNCAQKYIKNQSLRIKFISCMFEAVLPSMSSSLDWYQIAGECSEQLGLSSQLGRIKTCATDLEGSQLHYQAGLLTGSRTFIPTVEMSAGGKGVKMVLDSREMVRNLGKEICDLYKRSYGKTLQPCW